MNVIGVLKSYCMKIWQNQKNRILIRDVLFLGIATVVFHFIYWYGNMNEWIFGPFTQTVYDFFRHLAFNLSLIPCKLFLNKPFDIYDTTYYFYQITSDGMKMYVQSMDINIDCSGVKQLLQFLLIMILCRGILWQRLVYWLIGCVVILFFNAVRIFLTTLLFINNPGMFQQTHDWIARPTMYLIIFCMWVIWITYFSENKQKSTKKENPSVIK